ncbi:unnamed protein product [Heligmosomoides polygyrus]|uniref:Peptidase A2 domain-containing protein n=1 Tax=Heligmosomoides polygyrus TaxID=6339 RepID=A0A183FP31_HELPZ|nr:unnamed protein product [Heligmosomoides polygyrus]
MVTDMVPPPQDLTEEALLGPQGAPGVASDHEMDAEEQNGSACQLREQVDKVALMGTNVSVDRTPREEVMGLKVKALLDTGSETSIAPLSVLKLAKDKDVDICKFVKRILGVEAVVRNASVEPMQFIDIIKWMSH